MHLRKNIYPSKVFYYKNFTYQSSRKKSCGCASNV